jgi:hypothetical protein
MSSAYLSLHYYIVFATKGRALLIEPSWSRNWSSCWRSQESSTILGILIEARCVCDPCRDRSVHLDLRTGGVGLVGLDRRLISRNPTGFLDTATTFRNDRNRFGHNVERLPHRRFVTPSQRPSPVRLNSPKSRREKSDSRLTSSRVPRALLAKPALDPRRWGLRSSSL